MKDIEYMYVNNLVLGGSMDNVVVLDEFKVLNLNGLCYSDEFVKYKILDCVGDMFMIGYNILGKIMVYKLGYDLNNKLFCKIMVIELVWEWVIFDILVIMLVLGLEVVIV